MSRKILIVDDETSMREFLSILLGREGYAVETAADAESALALLAERSFDLIISDVKMPGLDGIALLQRVKRSWPDTAVLMITAYSTTEDAVEAMKLGAYDYVRKEQVEVDHIGILIDGVYERYLFRKEKDRREAIEREREKSLIAIETFHSTLASIAQIVNNSLSMVSLNIQEHETKVRPFVTDEGQQRLSQVFADLKQEYSVIASAVKSMLDMANVLHGNFTDANYTQRLHEMLSGNLKSAQQRGVSSIFPKKQ